MTQSLAGLSAAKITEVANLKEKYRGRQILEHVIKGVTTFDEMTNLPKAIRKELEESFTIYSSSIIKEEESADSTVKLAIQLHDGLIIESVLLTDKKGRKTACLSSQVGCAMNCLFCRTGKMGLKRNLYFQEIIEQLLHLKKLFGAIDNIVFMGMGEPFKNTDQVLKAIDFFTDSSCLGISQRRITISTCGIIEGVLEIKDKLPQIRLAVSLVTASEKDRLDIMPITKSNNLTELKKALLEYEKISSRRITLECTIIKNINDSATSASEIADWARGLKINVNVIPWNPVSGINLEEPSERKISEFCAELERRKVPFTRRYRRGNEVNAACGQLAVNVEGEQ